MKKAIREFTVAKKIQAGCVISCVGSLIQYNIRYANNSQGTSGAGHFEVLSVNGTVSANGSHLHIAISDETGNLIGGHLLDGNIIYITAEVVIANFTHLQFTREHDYATGYKELIVKENI